MRQITDDDIGLTEYQKIAHETAIYPSKNEKSLQGLMYCCLGAAEEIGEIAGKVKRIIRDNNGVIDYSAKIGIIKELGDSLWYLSQIAQEIDIDFGFIAIENIEKLQQRKKNNTLHGSGDNR